MTKREIDDPSRPFRHRAGARQPKKSVNLSVDAELLALARDLGLNLSQTLEEALRRLSEAERQRRWKETNRESLASFQAYFERNGTLAEAALAEDATDVDDPAV